MHSFTFYRQGDTPVGHTAFGNQCIILLQLSKDKFDVFTCYSYKSFKLWMDVFYSFTGKRVDQFDFLALSKQTS